MKPALKRKPKPVTIERLERALDRLAEFIVLKGAEGWKWVPIYKMLDAELIRLKTLKDDMSAIRKRARQSKDRGKLTGAT